MTENAFSKSFNGLSRLHWVHWIIILFSLALTLGAWHFSQQQIKEKVIAKFNRESDQILALVRERMSLYENALEGGGAYLNAQNGKIDYYDWKRYAESLRIDQAYPGINGIGVIFQVEKPELETYLANERRLRPDFKIHPQHQQNEYWPITYIEPENTNHLAIGLDMAFETNRYSAILKAKQSKQPQITGPIVLVQDQQKTPGFLFYYPVFSQNHTFDSSPTKKANHDSEHAQTAALIAVTYAPFIMAKLMEGTLAHHNRLIGVSIKDQGTTLFSDDQAHLGLYTREETLPFYGRSWQFRLWSNRQFENITQSHQPLFILFGGLLIDSLILILFLILTRSNQRAILLAEQLNHDLIQKSDALEISNRKLNATNEASSKTLKLLNAIYDSSPDVLLTTDLNGRIQSANTATQAIFALSPEQCINAELQSHILVNDQRLSFEALCQAVTQSVNEDITSLQQAPLAIHHSLIHLESDDIYAWLIRDITKERESENNKRNFISTVSHELRTPLTSIVGSLALLVEKMAPNQDAGTANLLAITRRNSDRLIALINDILDISKIEAGKLEFRISRERLVPCLEEAINVNRHYANQSNLEFNFNHQIDATAAVEVDLQRFNQIMSNLLSNAIKFSPPMGKIDIAVKQLSDCYEISVRDYGSGIPAAFQDKIFGKFSQADSSSSRSHSGTGLGLAITKSLVETMGGQIGFDNQQPGTRFYFTLPKVETKSEDKSFSKAS